MFDNDNDDFMSSEDIFGSSSSYDGEERLDGGSNVGDDSYDLDELMAPGGGDSTGSNKGGSNQSFGEPDNNNKSRKDVIKYAIIAIIGLVILLIAAIGLRKFVNSRSDSPSKPNKTVEQPVETSNDADNAEPTASTSANTGSTNTYVDMGDSQASGGTGEWIKFDGSDTFEFSGELESTFTVTSIDCYAMVANSYDDKAIKGVLTGNISGLVGTYKLEVPYDKVQGLSVGVSFKCYYKMADTGNYKVVTGIRY